MSGSERKPLSAPYTLSIGVILLCGIATAVLMYRDARRAELDRAEAAFVNRATLRHVLTREILSRYTESLFGVSAIFAVDASVTRAEFQRTTAHLQQHLPGALAFEWVPNVANANRTAFETALASQYPDRGFQIIEFDAAQHARRAAERPRYSPIALVEPMSGNEIVLGYDLATGPTRVFLERARESRQTVATHQFALVQNSGQQTGLVIICPVFRSGQGQAEEFAGFFQCVFDVPHFLQTACTSGPDPMLDLLFVDNSEVEPVRRVLYFDEGAKSGNTQPMPTEEEFRREAPFTREMSIPFGGREWLVVYRPQKGWIEQQQSWNSGVRATAVLLMSGLLAGLVTVIGRRSMTIQRQVEQRTTELAESRRQFANLLHALPGMAYRAAGDDALEIVFASEGALALTGWHAADFMSGAVHLRDLLRKDDLERVLAHTREALKAHRDIEIEYRIRTRGGDEKSVLARGRGVYDAAGRLQTTEALVIDITDSKRAESDRLAIERKLLETQKLESLGLLAGGIAHDFNNILSAVLGNASLARMSLPAGSPVDPQLRAIETASLRAAELCRQMLAYAGKGRFVVERVDLSALVEDLLPLLRVSIARTAVLHLGLACDLPGVKADATQVRQIVMNLVLNAVDALAGRDGEIGVSTGVIHLDKTLLARCATGSALPAGDYVFLEVSDTGSGMSPQVIAKIFDPFFTTKVSGRGLGLAAVLGIIRGHNGALLVESEVGKGSTFKLFLPAITGEATRIEVQKEQAGREWHHGGDVLVIEDEEPVRVVLVELLKAVGFNAVAVPDGKSGVALFQQNAARWSLVVIDLLMPGMSGEATLGALRAISTDVRVLLVSGYSEDGILKRVSHDGRVAFLGKPFRQEAFEQTLRDLLK